MAKKDLTDKQESNKLSHCPDCGSLLLISPKGLVCFKCYLTKDKIK